MNNCQILVSARLCENKIVTRGGRNFSGAKDMDEVAGTCAAAISTILDMFHETLVGKSPDSQKFPAEIRELSAMNVLFGALCNYLGKDSMDIVDRDMKDLMNMVRDVADKPWLE